MEKYPSKVILIKLNLITDKSKTEVHIINNRKEHKEYLEHLHSISEEIEDDDLNGECSNIASASLRRGFDVRVSKDKNSIYFCTVSIINN